MENKGRYFWTAECERNWIILVRDIGVRALQYDVASTNHSKEGDCRPTN